MSDASSFSCQVVSFNRTSCGDGNGLSIHSHTLPTAIEHLERGQCDLKFEQLY